MAKRKTEPVNDQPDYEDVEPLVEDEMVENLEVLESAIAERRAETVEDMTQKVDAEIMSEPHITDGILEPGDAPAKPLVIAIEPTQAVTFQLPRAVLFALIDPTYEEADVERAVRYGLLEVREAELVTLYVNTLFGELVLAGTDQTALRHKINAGWRNKRNAENDRG